MQTVITRDSIAVPWGFRLKGGAEYNVPLSILKVNEGSPSQYKLEVGDVIASIGNYPALNLKHEEALNIIRMFDLSLPLIIHRQQALFSPSRIAAKPGPTPVVWRPQSVSSYEPPSTPKSPRTQNFSFNQPQLYQPQYQTYQSNYQPPQPQVFRPQVYQPNQPVYSTSPPVNRLVVSPPPQAMSPIPPPPPLPDFSAPTQSYKAQRQVDACYNRLSSDSSSSSVNPVVPDALLNKVLSKSPMGQKPFSYTPGGLDLSHVRESARVKRYEQMSASQETNRSLRQTSVGPDFGSQYQPRHPNSHFQNFNHPQASQFQTYNPPSVPAPPPPPPMQTTQPVVHYNQASHASLNRSSSVSTESFVSKTQKSNAAAFNLTPELLQKAKNNNSEKRDLRNQSFSFKMLNKWIADSESNTPIQLVSKKDEEESSSPKPTVLRKSEVVKALEEDETKRPCQSQSPQTAVKFNPPVPSKVFQYVDRKFSDSSETKAEIQNLYQKVPARERDQEPPVSRYKGNHIPSKTFKYLQYITQNESESTSNTTTTTQNAEPVMQTAQVQVATSNQTKTQVSHDNSYIEQQARQHSLMQQEIITQNTNSASFPASEPALESTKNSEKEIANEEPSESPSPAPLESKPDLILNSTQEEILVESVIESLSNPEAEAEPEKPQIAEDSEPHNAEQKQEEEDEETQREVSASDEPANECIPDSLSLSNEEVINTDIDLNKIVDTISKQVTEGEQDAQNDEESRVDQAHQVVTPLEINQSEEHIETSEF